METLGICSDLSLLRLVVDGIPPWRDSNLLIKDLVVDEVPLRIYQPKWPPAGKRRGQDAVSATLGLLSSRANAGQAGVSRQVTVTSRTRKRD